MTSVEPRGNNPIQVNPLTAGTPELTDSDAAHMPTDGLTAEARKEAANNKDRNKAIVYVLLSAAGGALFIASCILGARFHDAGGAVGAALGSLVLGCVACEVLHRKNEAMIEYNKGTKGVEQNTIVNDPDILRRLAFIFSAGSLLLPIISFALDRPLREDPIGNPKPYEESPHMVLDCL